MKHYIGLDLGGTKTEIIVLDENSNELFRTRNATPKGDYKATLKNIEDLVIKAESATQLNNLPVGIGIPGTISRKTGCVKNANSTWLNGQPMQQDLSSLLGRDVKVMNDANCLAVSEAVDGAGKGHELVFAAILGTGCGAGIAFKQKSLLGPNGLAGEWGHVTHPTATDAEKKARPCYCGKAGCIETFISGTGLQHSYQILSGGEHLTGQEIAQLAQSGDITANKTLQSYQQQVVDALAMIVNIMDPDIIVLGGGASNMASLYPYINQHLAEATFGKECDTQVVQSIHGDSSGVRGAAWLNL